MATIFNAVNGQDNRGHVAVLPQTGIAVGSIMQIDEWGGFSGFKAIFTQVQHSYSTNHAVQHMLGDRLHLYVFGDRVGVMELSGLAFFGNCSGNDRTGVYHVQEYWRRNKLSRRAAPLRVTLDSMLVHEGFLCAFRCAMASTSNLDQRICQFGLSLILTPEDAGRQG